MTWTKTGSTLLLPATPWWFFYYAAFCGLYDLAERSPRDTASCGSVQEALLRVFRVANLLCQHGAVLDVRCNRDCTLLCIDIWRRQCSEMAVSWLFNHGADISVPRDGSWTPLRTAGGNEQFEARQLLLDHNAVVNFRDDAGNAPLCRAIIGSHSKGNRNRFDIVRRLLEHGVGTNLYDDHSHSTLLHQEVSRGMPEVA